MEDKKDTKQETKQPMHETQELKKPQETKQEKKQDPKQEDTNKPNEKEEKIKELINDLQRLQAEFENFKKRTRKEQEQYTKYANESLIYTLLPIIDNFELALKQKKPEDNFTKGIELIYSQLFELLEKQGLKKIEAKGKYNPQLHEALLQEHSDKEKDTILEELQSGYRLGDKIIRAAKVKISAGKK